MSRKSNSQPAAERRSQVFRGHAAQIALTLPPPAAARTVGGPPCPCARSGHDWGWTHRLGIGTIPRADATVTLRAMI